MKSKPFHIQSSIRSRRLSSIGAQVGRRVEDLSPGDQDALLETFSMLAKQYNCSIKNLKKTFMSRLGQTPGGFIAVSNDALENRMMAFPESIKRRIPIEDTVSYICADWRTEYVNAQLDQDEIKTAATDRDDPRDVLSESELSTYVDLTGRNINMDSTLTVRRIKTALDRLAYKYTCPLERLRQAAYDSLDPSLLHNPEALLLLVQKIREVEVPAESKMFRVPEDETGQYYVARWLEERANEIIRSDEQLVEIRRHIASLGVNLEEVDKTVEGLNLVPDLSKNDNLENKLFRLAKELANYIGYYFKPFPKDGFYEALMYCGVLLLHFRE